ncbi:MAG: OmpA family protein [Bacteroidota bacterium]
MSSCKFVLVFLLLSSINFCFAQRSIGLSTKFIFVDFENEFDEDLLKSKSAGIEVALVKELTDFLDINVPIRYASSRYDNNTGLVIDHEVFGIDLIGHLKYNKGQAFVPYALLGFGGYYDQPFDEFVLEAPLGLGLDVRLSPYVRYNLEASYRLALSDNNDFNHYQLSTGFIFLFGEAGAQPIKDMNLNLNDKDGDGVADENDACPNVPGFKKYDGCPDTDGDGIPDDKDKCPGTKGMMAFEGCPDTDNDGIVDFEDECPTVAGTRERNGCPFGDADNDGVADDKDACPNQYGLPRYNGCPDSDGDGIIDKEDECPNTVGLVRYNGCPDTDGDGIIDSRDRCPARAGTAANNGCPSITAEDRAILTRAITDVRFETGKAELKTSSFAVLNQIADLMAKYPDYNLVISGHTDNVGEEGKNQLLSEDRARACFNYLLRKGVQGYRMKSFGFGESQPIDSNQTETGRSRNRRVTFEMKFN